MESEGSYEGGFLCVIACLGKILMVDNLIKRGFMTIVDWCSTCN